MKKSNQEAFKFALLYTLIVICIVSIPLSFYISLALKHSEITKKVEMMEYANFVKTSIYSISDATNTFYFPRSLIYATEILGENRQPLFSLVAPNLSYDNSIIQYETTLMPNKLGAHYLVLVTYHSKNEVILEALYICLSVLFFIFITSYFLMRRSLVEFEATNKRVERFFKDAMHELKTPLGIMQLNLDIIRTLWHHNAVNRTMAALKSLATIYDDIEYMIKNQKIEFVKEQINFCDFLKERVYFFDDLACIKQIKLNISIQDNVTIFFNRFELQRIIDNTLSNAIKYSNSKTNITILLTIQNKNLILSVQDEGIGIDNLDKIFDRYYRGDSIKGGFGIGLAIVKNICNKNNVQITVDSQVGKGTTFRYFFPQ